MTRPALDPELRTLLADMPLMTEIRPEMLPQLRQLSATPVEPLLDGRDVDRRELTIPTPDGAEIPLSIFSPAGIGAPKPCVFWIHGGGMIMGDRFSQLDIPFEWLDRFGAVVVSVDHRLAPEATGTTLVDDCHRGLLWVAEHAEELGVDPARIVIAGASAGGGLAAGVTLMARDLGAPAIAPAKPFPATSPPLSPTISPACRPPTSTPEQPRSSATRTSRTPPGSGPRAVRRSCTSGRAASTASTPSTHTPGSPSPHAAPAATGSAAS